VEKYHAVDAAHGMKDLDDFVLSHPPVENRLIERIAAFDCDVIDLYGEGRIGGRGMEPQRTFTIRSDLGDER